MLFLFMSHLRLSYLHGSLKSWCKGEKNEGPSYILQRHKDVTLYSNALRWS